MKARKENLRNNLTGKTESLEMQINCRLYRAKLQRQERETHLCMNRWNSVRCLDFFALNPNFIKINCIQP